MEEKTTLETDGVEEEDLTEMEKLYKKWEEIWGKRWGNEQFRLTTAKT